MKVSPAGIRPARRPWLKAKKTPASNERDVLAGWMRRPGACAPYRGRAERLVPSAFWRAYDRLCQERPLWAAALVSLRILRPAVRTMQAKVPRTVSGREWRHLTACGPRGQEFGPPAQPTAVPQRQPWTVTREAYPVLSTPACTCCAGQEVPA